MVNLKLVVGSLECPIQTLVSIIGEDEQIIDKWSSLARGLCISNTWIKKLRQDISLNKISYSDLIYDVIEKWIGLKGQEAKLITLTLVIEEECQAVCVAESIRLRFNFPTTVADTLSWDDLTETLQARVLATANKLFPNLELKFLTPILNGAVLQQLISGIPDTLPESLPYYVNRKVVTRNTISPDIFEMFSSHIFLISGIERYELSKLSKEKTTDSSSNQLLQGNLTVQHIKLDSTHHFHKICNMTTKPVHMFRFEKNKLRWLKSRGGISAVQECVDKFQDVIIEEEFMANFNRDSSQSVCIVDSPGMGKSVLLAQIGRTLRHTYPGRAVTFLALGQVMQHMRQIDAINFLQQVLSNVTINDNQITLELLLDGFDEIEPSDMKIAHELLKTIRTCCGSIRMWVTCKPHLLLELERSLDTISFKIQPFSFDDQVRFLTTYWLPAKPPNNNAEKLKSFACHCLKTLGSTMKSKDCDVAGIPLQCLLIGEVYEEDAVAYANTEHFGFPPILITSIAKLYESLIDRKFQKSGITKTKVLMDMHVRLSLELLFPKQFLKLKHLFSPVKVEEILKVGLLQASNSSTVPVFLHRTIAEYLVAWFVESMLQEDFDEVWFADFFFRDLLKASLTGKHVGVEDGITMDDFSVVSARQLTSSYTIYRDIYYEFSHGVISYFLDSIISNVCNTPTHLELHLKNNSNFISALQQLVWSCATSSHSQILKFFTRINAFQNCTHEIFERQFLLYAIEKSSLEILRFVLLQFQEHHQFDADIQSEAICVAARRGEFSIVEFLIKEKHLKLMVEQLNDKTKWLLHECVECSAANLPWQVENRIQVIRMLVDINPCLLEIKDLMKCTPIFSNFVHIKLKGELIRLGADAIKLHKYRHLTPVLHFDWDWYQPIYIQRFSNDFHKLVLGIPEKVLKKLVRIKHSVSGRTLLHHCLQYFDLLSATLQVFQDVGADFNSVDKCGYSILATAVITGRSAVTIRKLMKCGANIYFRKGWRRRSLLHLAVGNYSDALPESVAVLVEQIGLNMKDLTLKTPLDYAKENGASCVKKFEQGIALAGRNFWHT